MSKLSSADHSVSPPRIDIPRDYNAAHDLLESNLQAGRGEKIAYIDDNESCTYAQLAERVNRFAHALCGLGLQIEQRVLLCMLDTIDFPVAFLGAIKAGIVPVATNTLLTSADFEYMLNDSRARALVVSAALLPTFKPLVGKLPFLKHVIVSGGDASEFASMQALIGRGQPRFDTAPTVADDMCFWLYSSGSTGAPKGTVHIHSSPIQTAELFARPIVGLSENDVVFSASKLPFAYGLGNSLSFPLAVGATAVAHGRAADACRYIRTAAQAPAYGILYHTNGIRRLVGESGTPEARRAAPATLYVRRGTAAGRYREALECALWRRHTRRNRFNRNASYLSVEPPGGRKVRNHREAGSRLRSASRRRGRPTGAARRDG